MPSHRWRFADADRAVQVARLLLTGRDCLQQAAEKVCTQCFWWPLADMSIATHTLCPAQFKAKRESLLMAPPLHHRPP